MQNYPNSACTKNTPDLHAELLQFCMCKKHFFVNAAILHVHIWRWGVLAHLVRKTYHIYMQNYPNSACAQNTFFVHALARQFCMYADHFFRTRGNSACTHLAYTRGLGLLCNKKKYLYLNKKRFSIYAVVNMRGTNSCEWLLLGKTYICGRSCMGKYCSVHNARIAKGGGTIPCIGCGVGVKTALARFKECGADCAQVKKWWARQQIFREEFLRLSTIEI